MLGNGHVGGANGQGGRPVSPLFKIAASSSPRRRLALSWGEVKRKDFGEGQIVAFGTGRGELVQVVAMPDAGKTTISLNAAINRCLGKEFEPLTSRGDPMRVLYVDGENSWSRLQADLLTMTQGFGNEEQEMLDGNLALICSAEILGQPLTLTDPVHLAQVRADAQDFRADVVIIDTMSALCPLNSENDNAEQLRRVWRPLKSFAEALNAVVVLLHHPGKRGEDWGAMTGAYIGRGGSAAGGFARTIWKLMPDEGTPGWIVLSCEKKKGKKPPKQAFALRPESRWYEPIVNPAPALSPMEEVVSAVTKEMRTEEVVEALNGLSYGKRSIERYLKEAVAKGLLERVKQGFYAPRSGSVGRNEEE